MSHDPIHSRQAQLDHDRPFATVYGEAPYRYEQDGKRFDRLGLEILTDKMCEDAAKHQPKRNDAAVSENAASSAAERMRRTRERRRAGIIEGVDIEITKRDVDQLVVRHLKSKEETDDREKSPLRFIEHWKTGARLNPKSRTRRARAVTVSKNNSALKNSACTHTR